MKRLALLVLVGLLAGCGGTSTTGPTVGQPLLHRAVVLDPGSLTPTLRVASGATSVTIRIAPGNGPGALATTPATASERPVLAKEPGGTVVLTLASTPGAAGGGGPSDVQVTLSAKPVWNVELAGGATDEMVDARAGTVGTVDFVAGTTNATVRLAARSGTQNIREDGGATEFTVTAPSVVAAKVVVGGGASELVLAGTKHTGIGGNQTFATPSYDSASQRVSVDLIGGVSHITVR